MSAVAVILILLLSAIVLLVLAAPLRAAGRRAQGGPLPQHGAEGPEEGAPRGVGDLLAAREAKYREIRDAEMDYRTGKLSREDYEAIDGELRMEAIEILDRLEADQGAQAADGADGEQGRRG